MGGALYNGTMRIYSKSTLRDFWETHADAEQPLKSWYSVEDSSVEFARGCEAPLS